MSGVRLLVGTRKGAFILTSDGTRIVYTYNGSIYLANIDGSNPTVIVNGATLIAVQS